MGGAFTEIVCSLLLASPSGKVTTYGALARAAGSPRGARQVVRILHTQSNQRGLPWHRVVASGGRIAFSDPEAFFLQREMLRAEEVDVSDDGRIDMKRFEWEIS